MDKLKYNNSILSKEQSLLELFKLKYDYLPSKIEELDDNVKETLKIIDEAYINETIDFDEALFLISKLFGGQKVLDNINNKKESVDSNNFYNSLINNEIDKDKLDDLFYDNKINYQMYSDGLNYLSSEKENDLSITR